MWGVTEHDLDKTKHALKASHGISSHVNVEMCVSTLVGLVLLDSGARGRIQRHDQEGTTYSSSSRTSKK